MEYATRISVIRAELGLTQPQLAAALGVSVRSVQNYEAGTTIPYKHFRRLEEMANKPPGWMEQDGHPDVTGHGWPKGALLLLLLATLLAAHFGDGDLWPHDEWWTAADRLTDFFGGDRIGL